MDLIEADKITKFHTENLCWLFFQINKRNKKRLAYRSDYGLVALIVKCRNRTILVLIWVPPHPEESWAKCPANRP